MVLVIIYLNALFHTQFFDLNHHNYNLCILLYQTFIYSIYLIYSYNILNFILFFFHVSWYIHYLYLFLQGNHCQTCLGIKEMSALHSQDKVRSVSSTFQASPERWLVQGFSAGWSLHYYNPNIEMWPLSYFVSTILCSEDLGFLCSSNLALLKYITKKHSLHLRNCINHRKSCKIKILYSI